MQISFIDLQKLLHCSFELVSGLFPGPLCCLILVLNMRKVAVWTTISLQAAQLCREENAWVALTLFMSFPVLHLTRGITMFSSHAQRGHCTGPIIEYVREIHVHCSLGHVVIVVPAILLKVYFIQRDALPHQIIL